LAQDSAYRRSSAKVIVVMAFRSQSCLCALLCLAVVAQGAKVTPMEKVVSLLKDLSAKVAAEGKKEAAQYDKFACFCKEQADEKLYSIEKSDAKIGDLKAEIKELGTAIAKLNGETSKLSKQITNLGSELKTKTEKRAKSHAEYQASAKDMNEAIDACGAAIDALRDSKTAMKGAKTSQLLQVTNSLVKAVTKQAQTTGTVALLSKLNGAPKFQYQSNAIIATIEDLMAEFKGMKKDLDMEEFDTNSAFEKNKLGLSNTKKFAEKERAEKEAITEAKTESKEAATSDKDDEVADRDADQNFLDKVTAKCETTARLFDSRSSTRADELKALNDATTELQSGAAPNFASNKKLVGLQKRAVPAEAPATFVQISSVQHVQSGKEAVLQRIRSFLDGAADRTGSPALSALAVRVSVAADHFVKVRGLIKDLISKLKADAKSEATQKGVCDVGMAKHTSGRDEANAKIEAANAKITVNTANKNDLEDESNRLASEIAELKKGLLEATELREGDKADNDETRRMSKEGAESVQRALQTLKGFYGFVQTGKYTPPNADRDGNTVGDLAPEVFDSSYAGAGEESKGILGILEVVLSDFQRTNKKTKDNEKEAQDDFDGFEKDTNADVKTKNDRIKKAGSETSDAEADILEAQGAKSDAQDLLDSSLAGLEELEAMCVKGEETWEERKQKREDEVEALKEALAIFQDWQE